MNLNSEDLAAVKAAAKAGAAEALNEHSGSLESVLSEVGVFDEPQLAAEHPSGLIQTVGSQKHWPGKWYLVSLQLNGNYPTKLSPEQKGLVQANCECNADGSLEGSTTSPGRFPQADSAGESAGLARATATNFVMTVEWSPQQGRYFRTKKHLGAALGLVSGGNSPSVEAVRAVSWEAFETFVREGAEAAAAMGLK